MGRGQIAVLSFATLALAAAVAGCGGGGSSDTTIARAAFVRKADAICKRSIDRIQAGFGAYLKHHNPVRTIRHPSKADYEALVVEILVPNLEREISEIRALGVPGGDEKRIDAMLSALEEGIETAERDPEAVTTSSDAIFGIASRLAREYGLESCGSR